MAYRLGELARTLNGRVRGDSERLIRGIAPLDRAGPDQLSFLTNPRYRQAASATRAGALLVGPGSDLERPDLLEVEEPYLALARLLELFHPAAPAPPGVSEKAHVGEGVRLGRDVSMAPFAVIEDRVVLGDRVRVGAGSVIGEACEVGEGTELKPRVVLYPGTRVGRRCLVHSGVVLGGDGFGFATFGRSSTTRCRNWDVWSSRTMSNWEPTAPWTGARWAKRSSERAARSTTW